MKFDEITPWFFLGSPSEDNCCSNCEYRRTGPSNVNGRAIQRKKLVSDGFSTRPEPNSQRNVINLRNAHMFRVTKKRFTPENENEKLLVSKRLPKKIITSANIATQHQRHRFFGVSCFLISILVMTI